MFDFIENWPMIEQKSKKHIISGIEAKEVRESLARSFSGNFDEGKRKAVDALNEARKIYHIEWM